MTTFHQIMNKLAAAGFEVKFNGLIEEFPGVYRLKGYDVSLPNGRRFAQIIIRQTTTDARVFIDFATDDLCDVVRRLQDQCADPEPPQDAAEHLAREREAAEEFLREAEPEPFTPAQRAWILRRIEAELCRRTLDVDVEGTTTNPFRPEDLGEIDF